MNRNQETTQRSRTATEDLMKISFIRLPFSLRAAFLRSVSIFLESVYHIEYSQSIATCRIVSIREQREEGYAAAHVDAHYCNNGVVPPSTTHLVFLDQVDDERLIEAKPFSRLPTPCTPPPPALYLYPLPRPSEDAAADRAGSVMRGLVELR